MNTTSTQPESAAPPRPTGRALLLVMASMIVTLIPLQLDALIAATAVPTIVRDLGGFSQIAWVATAYLLTMAIGTILAGRIGDMWGRKRLHMVAVSTFLAGSAWSGLSTGMTEFILARGLQGLGAGMALTTVIAIVADVVPVESRARYQAMLAAVAPVAMIAGPTLGGVITDHLGWRWIFLLNVPLITVSLVVTAAVLRLPRRSTSGAVDVAGAVLASIGSAGAVLAATWGGSQYSWTSAQVLIAAAIGLVGFAVLVPVERRAENPILPLSLFRNRTVVMCLMIMFFAAGAVMMAATNFIPVFQQLAQHQSASSSGLLLLPFLLPTIGLALTSGHYLSRTGRYRAVLITGTLILAAGCALLATMDATSPIWLTSCYLVLTGGGLGMLFQTPLVMVQNSAPADQLGAASGTASFLRMLGGALGVGALGSLFTATMHSSLEKAQVPGLDPSTAASLTTEQLAELPAAASSALADAVSAGTSVLFWAALVLGLAAVIAAALVPKDHAFVNSQSKQPGAA